MQTSQSIVGAPWAEMMCKIAFLEACRLGEEASWNRHIISSTGRLFKWKISIYPVQEWSALNPILPGFLLWLLSWHGAHTQTHRNTQRPKLSYSVRKVTCVMEKGSLLPLVLGNWRVLRDSLAKTSIILSAVPLSWLFRSRPVSMRTQWLYLVATAYSWGKWGDRAAPGMNIWINSSREAVWHRVHTEKQSLQ